MPEKRTKNNQNYIIIPSGIAPPDYPFESFSDEFTQQPFSINYQDRRRAFLQYLTNNPSATDLVAPYHELARLYVGKTPHEGVLRASIQYVNDRRDCADFVIHSLLRLLYQFSDNSKVDNKIIRDAESCVLNFKYWPDEPGTDSMCTWTENHYILFSSAAYLAGQLYPKKIFANSGLSGEALMEIHRGRILSWLNLRFYTGFSEWLSNVYYDEDLVALISLADFCHDKEIHKRSIMMIDLILLDIALNSYKGLFGSTHGRSYEEDKKWANQEKTSSISKLIFGCGSFNCNSMSAIALATSPSYKAPKVLFDIANDFTRPELLNRQRMGIRIDQASWWGLKPNNFENGMHFLTMEAYFHPRIAKLFLKMLHAYGWWSNDFFIDFRKKRPLIRILLGLGLMPVVTRMFEHDLCRNTREEVNIYTYRTPDYMLSSAQDYRGGYGGDQQHIWQASLGPDAVCFTTHPARLQGPSPNYWTGSGTLPRVAQIKNVLIAIYCISTSPALYVKNELLLTHAWFPKDCFDEVVEKEGWIFARRENGYLGLFSRRPYQWRELPGEDQYREVIVHGKDNIWLCEMGRKETDGNFLNFVENILSAQISFTGTRIKYNSPSQGQLQFGWSNHLLHNGTPVDLHDFPRYGNPFVQSAFPPEKISISSQKNTLILDWINLERQHTGTI